MGFIWMYPYLEFHFKETSQDFKWTKKEGILIEHNLNEKPIYNVYYGLCPWISTLLK